MGKIDEGHVRIFDTTLRDGEQSPGAAMTSMRKLEVARALSRLGVDVIEAGFPAASPDDLAAVRAIADEVGTRAIDGRPSDELPIVCGLTQAALTSRLSIFQLVAVSVVTAITTLVAEALVLGAVWELTYRRRTISG